MSINLPHWLVKIVDVLGFDWPDIDEDQLREAAKHLRSYADDCDQSHARTDGIVGGDLQQAYTAQSYTALAQTWGEQSTGHMKSLTEACRVLAGGLEVAAVGVEGMKGAVIGQLIFAIGEFFAMQAAAAVTFGLAEAAEAGLIKVQNKILSSILDEFEANVIGALVEATIGPVTDQIDKAADRLLFLEAGQLALGGPPPGLNLDTAAMRTHGDRIKREADANMDGGRAFGNNVGALTFTSGG